MVDAVEQRHGDGLVEELRRNALERRVQLGRLGGHPEDVDGTVERGHGGDLDLEVSEERALDPQPTVVAPERLRPQHQHDLAPQPREAGAEERAHPAGSEHPVARHDASVRCD